MLLSIAPNLVDGFIFTKTKYIFLTALAEILSIKSKNGEQLYYIHYIDYNKRLDEWVTENRLDLQRIQFPKRDNKSNIIKNGTPSRPSSPELRVDSVYPSITVCCEVNVKIFL